MKNSAYYRAVARDLMGKRWKTYGLGMLVASLLSMVAGLIPYVGALALLLIT